jgi:hypothetical protein
VTRLKWKLVSVLLDIVLILTQDRCTICVERTIGSKIVLNSPDGTPRLHGSHEISLLFCFETVLVSVRDRCMVCARRTIALEIVLDALNCTTRCQATSGARCGPFEDSANLDAR